MNLATLFPRIAMAMHPAKYPDGKTPKGRYDKKNMGKTRKGAKHEKGKQFEPKQIFPVTPAQYRHRHLGNPQRAQIRKVKGLRKLDKQAFLVKSENSFWNSGVQNGS